MIETLIVILGIFVVSAFSIVIIILQKKNLTIGYWPLIGAVGALITISELFAIAGNDSMRRFFILISLFVFGAVALMKFWETMTLVE